ncbi:cytochrome oxidase assembly protein-domain-containing protein [Melampsora americana]|nr:cytochrome oxidase assembly protein-domain-containing protein [Melampsora americana]
MIRMIRTQPLTHSLHRFQFRLNLIKTTTTHHQQQQLPRRLTHFTFTKPFHSNPTHSHLTSNSPIHTIKSNLISPSKPNLTSPIVAHHLLIIATLVFSIVVVGGLTRLTESGLSITEWNLISGTLPPLSEEDWSNEFQKYKLTPEFILLNQSIDLNSFKIIYLWEWSHRFLGRLIGLSFLLPLPFFLRYNLIKGKKIKFGLLGIGTLIGAQGGLGWYMVKSGLDQNELNKRDGIPRVSQYRLAAHLAMAFTVYASCLRLAAGILRDWRLVHQALPIGGIQSSVLDSVKILDSKVPMRARKLVNSLTGLIFLTAVSGNMSENPTTVQFDHRVLASLSLTSILGSFVYLLKHKRSLPPSTVLWMKSMMGMVSIQVGLGISTLIYLVPTSLAAAHQAGSLVLLSLSIGAGISLRRPNRILRQYIESIHSQNPNQLQNLTKRLNPTKI